MNKKSARTLLGIAILIGGDYAVEYSASIEPRTHNLLETYAPECSYFLEPRMHIHPEMDIEPVAATAAYLAASGPQHFELRHYTWHVKQVGADRFDAFRDGQFMGTRSRKQLRMDAKFHSRYESLISELDRTQQATFEIVKGALSQFDPFPS